jgi:hypothetical protein
MDGEVLLWSARVGGTLVVEGAGITHPEGATLNGDGLVVDGGLFGGVPLQAPGRPLVSEGELRLQDAKISRYDHLKITDPVGERLAWLAREQAGYLPQPYEQLAAAYTRQGLDDAARDVLLAKCRRRQAAGGRRRPSAGGACCRTGQSATVTGRCGPRCGCCSC